MPKYQIILSSNRQLSDDEFQQLALVIIQNAVAQLYGARGFEYVHAMNLEGIRKELWEKKEKLLNEDRYCPDVPKDLIETTFEQIEDIFKMR